MESCIIIVVSFMNMVISIVLILIFSNQKKFLYYGRVSENSLHVSEEMQSISHLIEMTKS